LSRTTEPSSAKSPDPLATLRIDRSRGRAARGSWLGRLVVGILLLAIAGAAAWAWNEYGDTFTMPQVTTALVTVQTQGAEDSVLSAQGYLKSEKQAAIGAKVAGRVLKVYVREGQPVEAGEVLAELEHADVDQTIAAMKATLDAKGASLDAVRKMVTKAQADLVEVEATLAQDKNEFNRSEQLFKSKIQTASEFERAEAKLKASQSRRNAMTAGVAVAESRLTEAEAQLRESEARYRETEQQRQNLFVRAPFKGIVIFKEAEEGESIMPGGMGAASGRGAVVTVADLLHLEVEADVKENYVSRVKKDQLASIAVDAVPNHRFGGRVRTIIPMGDRAKGTVKVKVQLNVDEVAQVNDTRTETFTLFPEMAATVYFLGEGKTAASGAVASEVFVPQAALHHGSGGTFVWQVVDDRLQRVPVETGDEQQGRVLIRRGLKGGERVVVESPAELREQMRVEISP
jgi:RND family efflux transporter MFP subunit